MLSYQRYDREHVVYCGKGLDLYIGEGDHVIDERDHVTLGIPNWRAEGNSVCRNCRFIQFAVFSKVLQFELFLQFVYLVYKLQPMEGKEVS